MLGTHMVAVVVSEVRQAELCTAEGAEVTVHNGQVWAAGEAARHGHSDYWRARFDEVQMRG
jgi:hypothetical protein